MGTSAVLAAKAQALEMQLRRVFWHPLRRMMEIFHVLPLTAAVIVFFLLATDAQVREIYVGYLEDLNSRVTVGQPTTTCASIFAAYAAAALGLALISAVLYVTHYRLSTMRINVMYSSLRTRRPLYVARHSADGGTRSGDVSVAGRRRRAAGCEGIFDRQAPSASRRRPSGA